VFDFGVGASALLALVFIVGGGISGWFLRASLRDRGLELRSQAADIDWLRTALADSEKRCSRLAEWLSELEDELTVLRVDDPKDPKKRPGQSLS
jgi:hypothetical protein